MRSIRAAQLHGKQQRWNSSREAHPQTNNPDLAPAARHAVIGAGESRFGEQAAIRGRAGAIT